MKRFMRLSMSCLLVSAGCQSANRMMSWKDRDAKDAPPAKVVQDEQLPPPSQVARSDAAETQVQLGQQAVSDWYRNKSSRHLIASAKMHFEDALRYAPNHPKAHHGLGIVADIEKNYSVAEKHYLTALQFAPHDSEILGDFGFSYMLQGRLDEAERYLRRAVQSNPGDSNAANNLAEVQSRKANGARSQESYAGGTATPEAQIAQAGQEPQSPSPKNEDKGLFNKFKPQDKGEALTEDIQRRFAEHRQQQAAQGGQEQRPAPLSQFERMQQEERLKHQLTEIDRERYAATQGGALMLDDQTGAITRLPPGVQPFAPPPGAPQHSAPLASAEYSHTSPHAWARQGLPAISSTTGPQSFTPAMPAQVPSPQQQNLASSAAAISHPPIANPLSQPWPGVIPAQAEDDNGAVDRALYQEPTSPTQANAPAAAQQSQLPVQGAVTPQSWQGGLVPGAMPPPPPQGAATPDAFQQASKAAARMGMGLGPGSMVPVFPSAPPIHAPGTGSTFNSAQFPAPQRLLPTDVPPRDLRQAFQPDSGFNAPPQSSIGGSSMKIATPQYSQEQFGTASRFDTQTLEQSNIPQSAFTNPEVRGLDAQRQQMSRDTTQALQQVWGQGPMNSFVVPLGQNTPQTPPPGVMYTTQTANDALSPPPWPYLQNTPETAAAFENPPDVTPGQNSRQTAPPPYYPQVQSGQHQPQSKTLPQASLPAYPNTQALPNGGFAPPPYRPDANAQTQPNQSGLPAIRPGTGR